MSWAQLTRSSGYLLPFSRCAADLAPESVAETLAGNHSNAAEDDSPRSHPAPPNPPPNTPPNTPPPTIQGPPKYPPKYPPIHRLPTELLFLIAELLPTCQDLLHLSQSSHRLHRTTTPVLHSRAVTHYTLSWAARQGYESLVRTLLDNGVPVGSRVNTYSKTAIHYAATEGREGIVRLLLDRGADINSQGAAKQTALHLAALNGRVGVVRVLLDRGADVTLRDSMGNTPLLLAVKYGEKADAVARLLLEGRGCAGGVEAGESGGGGGSGGGTALHWAVVKGMEETVQLLSKQLDT